MTIARQALGLAALLVLAAPGEADGGGRCDRPGFRAAVHGRYHGRADFYGRGIRRHHGLGDAGFCDPRTRRSVRRFHGPGDGYCAPPYHGSRYTAPYEVIVVEPAYAPVVTPDYQRSSAPPVVRIVESPAAQRDAVPGAAPSPASGAWVWLAAGDARAALTAFAVEALRSMDDVEHQVGYGLAAATLGKNDTAVWAMRRVAARDAAALRGLALRHGVVSRVHALAEDAAGRAATGRDTDALFMAAVLHSLAGQDEPARLAVTAAIASGDTAPSTRALHDALFAPDRGSTVAMRH